MFQNGLSSVFTDQLHNKIMLNRPPQRIVSLVPSQTELLFALGLQDQVVGVTKFCHYPQPGVKAKKIIGGTKDFNFEVIRLLQPDLIIGNKEENYQAGIRELEKDFPVWMSDIVNVTDAYAMITCVGEITDTLSKAKNLVVAIKDNFSSLPAFPLLRAAYFIWRKPYMSVGQDTFIHHMLQAAGLSNVFGHLYRYPEIASSQLQKVNPAVILLSSEPYPFREKHILEMQEICPSAVIKLVDGELFSWYDSRLKHSAAYFTRLRQELATHPACT